MKKKILYSLFALVVTLLTVVTVHADAHTITTPAKAMSYEPNKDAQIYAITDDNAFDEFKEKVQFSAKSGSAKITPKSDATKIIITASPNMTAAATLDVSKKATELAGSDWFTAYCLDAARRLPQYSIFNMAAANVATLLNAKYADNTPKVDRQLGATTLIAVLNNRKLLNVFDAYKDHRMQIEMVYAIDGLTEEAEFSTEYLNSPPTDWDTPVSIPFLTEAGNLMTSLKGGNSITVLVKSVTFHKFGETEPGTVTATKLVEADSDGAGKDGYYKITYDAKDILFDKYDRTGAAQYKHSLWIIEHSYPSMTVDAFLAEVGSTKEELLTQIQTVYGSETFTDEEKENLVDNYLYWTVQYAMWKANDSFEDDDENRLGNELYFGSLGTDNVLNKVYQYLIKDRDEYTTYGSVEYDTAHIKYDDSNNDKVTTSGDYYIYGPYTAEYNVIDPSDITVEVTSSNKADVSIVDADGNVLTKVKNGQEFYVKCKKAAKITNVEIALSATGRSYDDNQKGTVYYANFSMNQNVITGLGYKDVQGSATMSLTYNPKTGVPNIAIVFIITLIAFSLGYLALSYNTKSMELN